MQPENADFVVSLCPQEWVFFPNLCATAQQIHGLASSKADAASWELLLPRAQVKL